MPGEGGAVFEVGTQLERLAVTTCPGAGAVDRVAGMATNVGWTAIGFCGGRHGA